MTVRPAPPAPAAHRLDQRPRPRARRGRGAERDDRHRRRAERRPRPARPGVVGAAGQRPALLGGPAAARARARAAAALGSGRGLRGDRVGGPGRGADQVAERRLDRRGEGRGRPDRGAAARVGGDRGRASTSRSSPDEFPGDLRWPATSVGHGVDVAADARGALRRARRAGSSRRGGRDLAEFRQPRRARGPAAELGGRRTRRRGRESPPGSTSAATCSSSSPTASGSRSAPARSASAWRDLCCATGFRYGRGNTTTEEQL